MDKVISKDISDNQQLRSQVDRATELLGQIAGHGAKSVTIKWSKLEKDASHFIQLEVSDSTGANATTLFGGPAELTNESYLRARLYRIWGDLLQDRSHKQLIQLSGSADVSVP